MHERSINQSLYPHQQRDNQDRTFAFYGIREGYAAILSTSYYNEQSRAENTRAAAHQTHGINSSHYLINNKYKMLM